PIRMVFRQMSVPRDSIPVADALQEALDACLERSRSRRIRKDTQFFERAGAEIRRPPVSILAVEDYGTPGLVGPSVPGQPFHALVKGSGGSQKSSSDAGGSFGIAKNAAFAVSRFRTVFYSTPYSDGPSDRFLAQGK